MERPACDIINEFLHLDLCRTVRGDEAKGWCPDPDDPGRMKFYLSRADCEDLARAFRQLAEELCVPG